VEERGQRRALPSCGQVRRPEVGDHGNPRARMDHRWGPQLQRPPHLGLREMAHRLPMRPDARDLLGGYAARAQHGQDRGRKALPELHVELYQISNQDRGLHQRMNALPQVFRELDRGERKQRELAGGARELDQRRVDRVGRGPGHEADPEHALPLAFSRRGA